MSSETAPGDVGSEIEGRSVNPRLDDVKRGTLGVAKVEPTLDGLDPLQYRECCFTELLREVQGYFHGAQDQLVGFETISAVADLHVWIGLEVQGEDSA